MSENLIISADEIDGLSLFAITQVETNACSATATGLGTARGGVSGSAEQYLEYATRRGWNPR